MKPPIEYRPAPPAIKKIRGVKLRVLHEDAKNFSGVPATTDEILAHKRAVKAAQMRRWRAKGK